MDWVQKLGGLDAELAAGGGGMSAGEAQLLAFTRLLLRDPGLVILDEAASRLDPITEARLEQAIDRLLAGRTAIVIAHRLHTVSRADDILILEEGRVVEFGPRADVGRRPGVPFPRPAANRTRGGAGMTAASIPSTDSVAAGPPRLGVWPFNRRLIAYAAGPFAVHAVLQIFYLGSRVLPGLVEKAVFDQITGVAPVTVSVTALVALYISIGLARMVATYGETWAGWTFRYTVGALVRRNLFAAHLRRPGAATPSISAGEAVNRYRTDVGEVGDFPTWLPDVAGNLVSFVIAVLIMARINWQITAVRLPAAGRRLCDRSRRLGADAALSHAKAVWQRTR